MQSAGPLPPTTVTTPTAGVGIGEEGLRRQGAASAGGGAGKAEDLAVAHHRVVQPHALHGRRHRPARGARRLIGQARER